MTTQPEQTEKEFQAQVIELAHLLGWEVMHVRTSIGRRGGAAAHQTTTSIKGWPDLFCFRPGQTFVAELKSATGRVSEDQVRVLHGLAEAGLKTFVWRPSSWDEIQRVLSKGP